MTIEAAYGVPTVAMHTEKFDRVAGAVAAQNGMPGLRQAFVPQPVMGKTAAELRAYIDGRDPISRRPVMQEVIEGLTRPFTDDERGAIDFDRSAPRLVEPDTEEALHRLFLERIRDHQRNKLFRKLKGAVIIGAVRNQRGKAVSVKVRADQVIGRSLARSVR